MLDHISLSLPFVGFFHFHIIFFLYSAFAFLDNIECSIYIVIHCYFSIIEVLDLEFLFFVTRITITK